MKRKSKFTILASATAAATAITPIVALAACAKPKTTASYVIDTKEKTKSIDKGLREVTYSMKVTGGLGKNQTLAATVKDVTCSQTDYSVKVSKDVEYKTEEKTALVTCTIYSEENALIKDGTTFDFSIEMDKVDTTTGKVVSTDTIKGFKLVYGAPTTSTLKLQGNAQTYTNPGELIHTYIYNTGTLQVDENCEFECDIEKNDSSTWYVDVELNTTETKYDPTTKNLKVAFNLYSDRTIKESDFVNFNFTLSCKKDGKELWRQEFKDYQLTFLDDILWIFENHQYGDTYAGEKSFNLYIAKHPDLTVEDLANINIILAPQNVSSNAIKLTAKKAEATIKEYQGEAGVYEYYDIPVTIEGVDDTSDVNIKFTTTLGGEIGGVPVAHSFDYTYVNYIATKATEPTTKTDTLINTKSKDFAFTLKNALNDGEELSCELVKVSGETSISATTSVKTVDKTATVTVTLDTEKMADKIGFNLKLICKNKNTGEIIWVQRNTSTTGYYELNYYETVIIEKPEIKTLIAQDNGTITLKLCGNYAGTDEGDITFDASATKMTNVTCTKIKSASAALTGSGKTASLKVTLVKDDTLGRLMLGSSVSFDYEMSGTIRLSGADVPWKKTIKNLKVDYCGTVYYGGDKLKTTTKGETTCTYKFDVDSEEPNISCALVEGSTHSDNTSVKLESFSIVSHVGTLVVKIVNTSDEALMNNDYCDFDVRFRAVDPEEGTIWEQTETGFRITYQGAFSCSQAEVTTDAATPNAVIQFADTYDLPEGSKYSVDIIRQKTTTGVAIKSSTVTSKDKVLSLNLEITKDGSLAEGDNVEFDLILTKTDTSGKVTYAEKFSKCKVTYDMGKIDWTSGWYIYECEEGGRAPSDPVYPTFTLKNALGSDQTLTGNISITSTSKRVDLMVDQGIQLSADRKSAYATMHLQTKIGQASFMYFGDNAYYDVAFTCKNADGSIAWTQNVKNCYVYALINPKLMESTKELKSKTTARHKFEHTVNIDDSQEKNVKYEVTTTKTGDSAGGTLAIDVEPTGKFEWDGIGYHWQDVKWKSGSQATEGQWVEYTMTVKMTYDKFPTKPVTFTFAGLKLTYADAE